MKRRLIPPAITTALVHLQGQYFWKPYHYLIYRQDPAANMFMIKRRLFGGPRMTPELHAELQRMHNIMTNQGGRVDP